MRECGRGKKIISVFLLCALFCASILLIPAEISMKCAVESRVLSTIKMKSGNVDGGMSSIQKTDPVKMRLASANDDTPNKAVTANKVSNAADAADTARSVKDADTEYIAANVKGEGTEYTAAMRAENAVYYAAAVQNALRSISGVLRKTGTAAAQPSRLEQDQSFNLEQAEKESISFLYSMTDMQHQEAVSLLFYAAVSAFALLLHLAQRRIIAFIHEMDGKKGIFILLA